MLMKGELIAVRSLVQLELNKGQSEGALTPFSQLYGSWST